MPGTPRGSLVFAWCGAALFALSLVFFLYSYLVQFGAAAAPGPFARPLLIDAALFTLFALHHSVFARARVKSRVQGLAPAGLERSLFTWIASVLFVLVCALWRAVPGELYRLTGGFAALGYAVQATGLILTARGSARLDVLDLAGVRSALARPDRPPDRVSLETTGLYGFVRHPIYFAWVLFVFGAPQMTMTRFVFATISTAYLAMAIPFEERALVAAFGQPYRDYQQRVRWRMIPGVY